MDGPAQADLDALPDGVVLADAHGTVTQMNARARQMLGTGPGMPLAAAMRLQDSGGRDWYAVNRPYDGPNIRSGIPEQSWSLPDGNEVLVTCGIARSGAEHAIDRVAVSLRPGRGRARLDRERSDLVATVAHELRSPLTGVKGFVQVLLNRWDDLSDEQKKLMLTTVGSDSERLSRLIAELLDVARLDTGRLSMFPRPSDSAVLVGRVVDSVRAGTSRPIELVVTGDLPEAHVDPDKFTQVVTNLVENGIRHGEGLVRVTMAPLPGDAEFPGVLMHVDDQGEGISEEIRRRVFTKFWTHGERGGSGLGMYLVNGLVRAHGGTLTISDAPDGGARVSLCWPAEDRRPG
ncbi:PAS domain-containing sensor histidine kinase [Nocardioides sp. AE5]|uniref:sensor histidine kinase n=1 Tax=Nocardioides sp. AE5 TaxID=2962573 RepID=UPI002882740A|nr:PAS domain-containing sensor histidine kinase [Nocardioides sp. AE5]MDT0201527.1 PAS domain-containing sensor histidine kinase [Nocardioides sp. AE5]